MNRYGNMASGVQLRELNNVQFSVASPDDIVIENNTTPHKNNT